MRDISAGTQFSLSDFSYLGLLAWVRDSSVGHILFSRFLVCIFAAVRVQYADLFADIIQRMRQN